jgi:hypothetical protein
LDLVRSVALGCLAATKAGETALLSNDSDRIDLLQIRAAVAGIGAN